MTDEEAKAVQEVAKTTGKAVDALRDSGSYLDKIFGNTFLQLGGMVSDRVRYYRYTNYLKIADKIDAIHKARRLENKPIPVPPQYLLPLLDGASLESEDEIQNLWAALIANATDPNRAIRIRKVFIEILRGLEPLDAKIMEFLSEPMLDEKYSIFTRATVNAEVIASGLEAEQEEVKISLQNLARHGCVIDSQETTLESLDFAYAGFRVNNPKSNFRLSHLGAQLAAATRAE